MRCLIFKTGTTVRRVTGTINLELVSIANISFAGTTRRREPQELSRSAGATAILPGEYLPASKLNSSLWFMPSAIQW